MPPPPQSSKLHPPLIMKFLIIFSDQLENGPMQVIGTPPTGKDGRYQFWSGPNCEASIFNTNHALPFKIDEMQATKCKNITHYML